MQKDVRHKAERGLDLPREPGISLSVHAQDDSCQPKTNRPPVDAGPTTTPPANLRPPEPAGHEYPPANPSAPHPLAPSPAASQNSPLLERVRSKMRLMHLAKRTEEVGDAVTPVLVTPVL